MRVEKPADHCLRAIVERKGDEPAVAADHCDPAPRRLATRPPQRRPAPAPAVRAAVEHDVDLATRDLRAKATYDAVGARVVIAG
jgi:hypothetical protein